MALTPSSKRTQLKDSKRPLKDVSKMFKSVDIKHDRSQAANSPAARSCRQPQALPAPQAHPRTEERVKDDILRRLEVFQSQIASHSGYTLQGTRFTVKAFTALGIFTSLRRALNSKSQRMISPLRRPQAIALLSGRKAADSTG